MFASMQTLIIFPVKVFIFRYYEMMDNTPAKKCRKSPKNRHIQLPFSPFYLRKCLNTSGHNILSQGTEENSNNICSLIMPYQSSNHCVITYQSDEHLHNV